MVFIIMKPRNININIGSEAENACCRAIYHCVVVERNPSLDVLSICLELGETAFANAQYQNNTLVYNKGASMFDEMMNELRAKDLYQEFNYCLNRNGWIQEDDWLVI